MTLRFCLRRLQCSRLQDAGVALLLAISTIAAACAQDQAAPVPAAPSTPRLVVYLFAPKGVNLADSIKTLDLSRMTDLNLAFGDPPKCDGTCTAQSDMAFSVKGQSDADIDAVVAVSHAAGVKVFLSVGGGGGDQMIIQFYNAGLSAPLVASLDRYIRAHHFDGVDVDIEDPANMGQPYASFVSLLTLNLHAEGKLVTAAVAKYLQASMPSSALHQFDFINVMNYSSYTNAGREYPQRQNCPRRALLCFQRLGFQGRDLQHDSCCVSQCLEGEPSWRRRARRRAGLFLRRRRHHGPGDAARQTIWRHYDLATAWRRPGSALVVEGD